MIKSSNTHFELLKDELLKAFAQAYRDLTPLYRLENDKHTATAVLMVLRGKMLSLLKEARDA